jgi:hypothetical protein
MALSRFWTFMLLLSIGYALLMLAVGRQHSLGLLVNGRQGAPMVVYERDTAELRGSTLLQDLRHSDSPRVEADAPGVMHGDTVFTLSAKGTVQGTLGTVPADGLFPTCKNTVMDLWLPLIGYLTFFCGLMNLLVDSRAMEKLARFLSPLFAACSPICRRVTRPMAT